MAVSAPRSDCQSMRGARGEAHAKEWPGAMIPALPAVASRPSPSFSSTTVTSWPALARKYAVVTPTTPPPRTRVFTALSRLQEVARAHRILGIEQELTEAGEVRGAGDLREDRPMGLDRGLAGDPASEIEAEQPPADERRPDSHEAPVMEERHPCARPRPARRRVDLTRTPHEGVGGHAGGVRQLVDEHVIDRRLAKARHDDLELGIDRLADGRAPLGDPLRELPPHGQPQVPRLDDREDVADADRDVDRHLARTLDLYDLPGQGHEGRRPLERDLADAVAVQPHDRLHGPRLGVDQDGRLRALARDHAGLDGHGRRADRALAARHVVATGIDEEEPELGARREGLRHHGDQEGPVATRLEAETRAEIGRAS